MTDHEVKLHFWGNGRGEVLVDGRPLERVIRVDLVGQVRHHTEVKVTLLVPDVKVHAEHAHVGVSEETRQSLMALGWTPPEGQA